MPEQEATQIAETQESVQTPTATEKQPTMKEYIASRLSAKNPAPASETGTQEIPTEEQPAAKDAESKPEDPPKKVDGGFQRKIDKQTKKISQLSEALEAERLARQTLEARLAGKPAETKSAVADDPEPKESDFNKFEDFLKAQAKWEVRQELRVQEQKLAQEAEQERLQETFKAYNQRVAEAKEEHEDWEEVVGKTQSSVKFSQQAEHNFSVAIYEVPNGPEVLYHLAKNPKELDALAELSPVRIVGEIFKLSAALAAGSSPEKSPKPKPVSTAPAPIEPVGGSQAKSAVPLDQMNMRDYAKARRSGRVS